MLRFEFCDSIVSRLIKKSDTPHKKNPLRLSFVSCSQHLPDLSIIHLHLSPIMTQPIYVEIPENLREQRGTSGTRMLQIERSKASFSTEQLKQYLHGEDYLNRMNKILPVLESEVSGSVLSSTCLGPILSLFFSHMICGGEFDHNHDRVARLGAACTTRLEYIYISCPDTADRSNANV